MSAWALSERVESAIRSGNDRGAAEALGRLQERTRGTDKPWGLGLEARSRGLVGEGASAEAAFREAVEQVRRTLVGVARGIDDAGRLLVARDGGDVESVAVGDVVHVRPTD